MSKSFQVNYSGEISANSTGSVVAFLDKRNIHICDYYFSSVPIRIVFNRKPPPLPHVQFSPFHPSLLCNTFQGTIKLWDYQGDLRRPSWYHRDPHETITDMGWSRIEPSLFATCSQQTNILIWDSRVSGSGTRSSVLQFPVAVMRPLRIRWHPSKQQIGCCYGTTGICPVNVWDMRSPTSAVHEFLPHLKRLLDLDWDASDPAGNVLCTCGMDGCIKLWDVSKQQDGELVCKTMGKNVRFVRFVPGTGSAIPGGAGSTGAGVIGICANDPNIPLFVRRGRSRLRASPSSHSRSQSHSHSRSRTFTSQRTPQRTRSRREDLVRLQTWKGHSRRIISMDFRIVEEDEDVQLLTLSEDETFRMWTFDSRLFPKRDLSTTPAAARSAAVPSSGTDSGVGGVVDLEKTPEKDSVGGGGTVAGASGGVGVGIGGQLQKSMTSPGFGRSRYVREGVDDDGLGIVELRLGHDGDSDDPAMANVARDLSSEMAMLPLLDDSAISDEDVGVPGLDMPPLLGHGGGGGGLGMGVGVGGGKGLRLPADDLPYFLDDEDDGMGSLTFQQEVTKVTERMRNVELTDERGNRATFRFATSYFGLVDVMFMCPHHYPKAPLNFHVIMSLAQNTTLAIAKGALLNEINEMARKYSAMGLGCVKEVVECIATRLDCDKTLNAPQIRTAIPAPPTCFASFSPSGHLVFCNTLSRSQKRMVDTADVIHYHQLRNVLLLSLDEDSDDEMLYRPPVESSEEDDEDDVPLGMSLDVDDDDEVDVGEEGKLGGRVGVGVGGSNDALGLLVLGDEDEDGDDDGRMQRGPGIGPSSPQAHRIASARVGGPANMAMGTVSGRSTGVVRESNADGSPRLLMPGFSPRLRVYDLRPFTVSHSLARKLLVSGDVKTVCRTNRDACLQEGNLALHSLWTALDAMLNAFQKYPKALRRRIGHILQLYEREKDVQTLAILTSFLPKAYLPEGRDAQFDHFKRFYGRVLECWGMYCQRNEIVTQMSTPETDEKAFSTCYHIDELEGPLRCSICRLPVRSLCMVCPKCHHGGHLKHIEEWFAGSLHCPICRCQCATFMLPAPPTHHEN